MKRFILPALLLASCLLCLDAARIAADEPVTLANAGDPGPNESDEPVAAKFSMGRAAWFLDSAALTWQKKRKCFTCHTNYAYLYARPLIPGEKPGHQEVRTFAEELVTKRWPEKGPRWDAEVVATAAALAANDRATTGKLHQTTREALNRMWEVQRDDGGWKWLKCNWPPMEHDDHYGVTLAAVAVGLAPDDYAKTKQATDGMVGIRDYLQNHPPENLHHRAMLLWASTLQAGLMTKVEQKDCIEALFSLQKKDGGWAAATLGDWKRHDNQPQDEQNADGYGTGFVIYVLRQAGVPADDTRIVRGIQWLKSNQRESGRWFSRSLYRDSQHFLSHAGTAFAVMAIASCDENAK